jgi:3-oxoadipate enol-lactonase
MGQLMALALLLAGIQTAASRLPVPGGELVYEVTGSGPAVVFLHGAFMDRRSWDAQVPAFASRYRVVRYDIRPFGESTGPEKAYVVGDDLRLLLDHLKIDRAHLVGHSFGGSVALDFALVHPERVASLTLVGAAPGGFAQPAEEVKYAQAVFAAAKQGDDAIVRAWLDHPMWAVSVQRPEVAKALAESTRRSLRAFKLPFAPYVPVKPPALERLGAVKAPTLVVVGDKDLPGLQKAADQMTREIPNAAREVIAGADHALPLAEPQKFNEAVLAFISTAVR